MYVKVSVSIFPTRRWIAGSSAYSGSPIAGDFIQARKSSLNASFSIVMEFSFDETTTHEAISSDLHVSCARPLWSKQASCSLCRCSAKGDNSDRRHGGQGPSHI